MSDHVYKIVEVVGTSREGVDAAVRNAISKVGTTTPHLDWYEVTQIRGDLERNEIAYVQVSLKVGCRITE